MLHKFIWKEALHFVHQRFLDYHNLFLTATYNGHFVCFNSIKVTSKMRISFKMNNAIEDSSGFQWNFFPVLFKTIFLFIARINVFKLSKWVSPYSWFHAPNPHPNIYSFKPSIIHTFFVWKWLSRSIWESRI